jgi:hypothetical protein
MWLDLVVDRPDLKRGGKLAWGIFGLVPLVPFLYVLTGGDLWLSRQLASISFLNNRLRRSDSSRLLR